MAKLQIRSTLGRITGVLLSVAPATSLAVPATVPGVAPAMLQQSTPTDSMAASSVPELRWSAPPDCPSEERFGLRLHEYLGRDVPSTTTVTAARIEVARHAAEYRIALHVEQRGRWRTRALSTKTCSEALDAAALVIALAIDPSVATRVPSSEASVPPTASPDGAALPASRECPSPPERIESVVARPIVAVRDASEPRRRAFSVYSGAQISYRQLPAVPVAVDLGAAYDASHLRLSVTTSFAQAVARRGAKGGDFILVRGRADACWITGGRLGIGPCAGVSVGALSGEGVGVTVTQRATELWWSTNFGAWLRYWHRDSAIVGAFTFVELPGRRPSFQLSSSSLYRPPAVGLVGGFTVGLIL